MAISTVLSKITGVLMVLVNIAKTEVEAFLFPISQSQALLNTLILPTKTVCPFRLTARVGELPDKRDYLPLFLLNQEPTLKCFPQDTQSILGSQGEVSLLHR